MSFPGSALPSFPASIQVVGLTNPKTTTPMSYRSIKAEADVISAKITSIINHIRNATLADLHAIEEHLGLVHPETNTFHDFDNRLGTIVNELHEVEPDKLDVVAAIVAIPANAISITPEVKETGASADTNCDVAAPSGASAEVSHTPDQAVS